MQASRHGAVVQRISVRDYGTSGSKALDFGGHIEVVLQTLEDCDEVIRAAVAAKDAMLAAGDECPSAHPGTGEQCTVRRPGHRWHFGPDRGAGVRTMWEDAAVLAESIASGQPVTVTDEPLPDCAGCGHEEAAHDRRPGAPVATGPCGMCTGGGCDAYALPQDTAAQDEPRLPVSFLPLNRPTLAGGAS